MVPWVRVGGYPPNVCFGVSELVKKMTELVKNGECFIMFYIKGEFIKEINILEMNDDELPVGH